MKVTIHTGQLDEELTWYSPCTTRRICNYSFGNGPGIHGFRLTLPCLIIEVLATRAKFLQAFGYCIVYHLHIHLSHTQKKMFLVASVALWLSSNTKCSRISKRYLSLPPTRQNLTQGCFYSGCLETGRSDTTRGSSFARRMLIIGSPSAIWARWAYCQISVRCMFICVAFKSLTERRNAQRVRAPTTIILPTGIFPFLGLWEINAANKHIPKYCKTFDSPSCNLFQEQGTSKKNV